MTGILLKNSESNNMATTFNLSKYLPNRRFASQQFLANLSPEEKADLAQKLEIKVKQEVIVWMDQMGYATDRLTAEWGL
jgi:hypothetical protein